MNVKQRRRYSDAKAKSRRSSPRFRDLADTDTNTHMDTEPWNKGKFHLLNDTMPMNDLYLRPDAIINTSATVPQNNNHGLILDVVLIFLSGLAIIIAMIVLVFAVVILFDRYCGCGFRWSEWTDELFPDEAMDEYGGPSEEDTHGTVAFKARLCGLTTSERRAVMEKAFAKFCTKYPMSPEALTDDDAKHIDKATKSRSNVEESSVPTTCAESSSVTSDATNLPLHVDLEGGDTLDEPWGAASHNNSVNSEGGSNNQIPAQIKGKPHSTGGRRCDEDSVSDFGSEADMTADSDNTTAEKRHTSTHYFHRLRRTETSCAICLGEYAPGDKILHGIYCSHIFHVECIMQWMEQCHDHCPYCRVEMLTPQDMRLAASQVLTKERLQALSTPRKSRRQRGAATHIPPNTSPAPSPRSGAMERNENALRENVEASTAHSNQGDVTPVRIVFDNSQEIDSVSPIDQASNDADAVNDDESVFSRSADRLSSSEPPSASGGEVLSPFGG